MANPDSQATGAPGGVGLEREARSTTQPSVSLSVSSSLTRTAGVTQRNAAGATDGWGLLMAPAPG